MSFMFWMIQIYEPQTNMLLIPFGKCVMLKKYISSNTKKIYILSIS